MLLSSCRSARTPSAAGGVPPPGAPAFVNVASRLGIHYRANRTTERPRDILQGNGSGCAFLDYDGDGKLDILLVGDPVCALYHNEGDHFRDVTREAGLDRRGHWIGVGVADIDNDGYPDICLTGYHTGALFHNDHGHFRDITASSGIAFPQWGQSAVFGDVNNDGRVDLYISAYARFGPNSQRYCYHGPHKAICGPQLYPPEIGRLYLNRGGGRFTDVTREAGLDTAHGRAWGAMFQDYDDDGWPDLYLANDMLPGDLFHNLGKGLGKRRGKPGAVDGAPRFKNVGSESGTAFDAAGGLQGGMAVDWADYDNDGRPDLLVTTFTAEANALYRNEGNGTFTESSFATGAGQPSVPQVKFGAKFVDFDNDGWRDLLIFCGHVEDNVELYRAAEHYHQPMLLLRNEHGRFENVSASRLAGLPEIVARGAAFGDFNNDGRMDALVMDLEGEPLLLQNQAPGGHWLGLRLLGTRSNSLGIGARVWVRAGGLRQRLECQTSGSLLSSSDPRVLFGLGAASRVEEVTVRWPSGRTSMLRDLAADRYVEVREPR